MNINNTKFYINLETSDLLNSFLYSTGNTYKENIDRVMMALIEPRGQILKLYFGLTDGLPLSYEQIGKKLGVTSGFIRQRVYFGLHDLYYESRIKKILHNCSINEAIELFSVNDEFNELLKSKQFINKQNFILNLHIENSNPKSHAFLKINFNFSNKRIEVI